MRPDLDTRARQASAGLKAAVDAAEFSSTPPVTPSRGRPLVAVLRPAIVMALLLVGAAVGVAVVTDDSAPETTEPPPVVPSTTIVDTTLAGAVVVDPEPAPPTTAYVPPTAPSTTIAKDLEPPHLAITSPEDGAWFEVEMVTFEGTTEPGARVFTGRWEADVEPSGEWSILLILSEGSNVARFVARDAAGNEAEAAVTVHYTVEKATTTTTTIEKELGEFTAYATYGSCAETPPYDVYYGSGEPGSLVHITSEYGSASVEVNGEGHWEKKVVFETAPPNQPFLVTVRDEFGRSVKFEFVHAPA